MQNIRKLALEEIGELAVTGMEGYYLIHPDGTQKLIENKMSMDDILDAICSGMDFATEN